MILRLQPGGGPQFELGADSPDAHPLPATTPLYGYTIEPPIGTQPPRPAPSPPIRTDVPCEQNDLPNLNGSAAPRRRARPGRAVSP